MCPEINPTGLLSRLHTVSMIKISQFKDKLPTGARIQRTLGNIGVAQAGPPLLF